MSGVGTGRFPDFERQINDSLKEVALELRSVDVIDLAFADRHVERRDRRPQRERMPLGNECGETGEEGGARCSRCVGDGH